MASFFEDLLDMFRSRVKNVFYSTFFTSWIIVNWKFVFIILFSDESVLLKFHALDQFYDHIKIFIFGKEYLIEEEWIYFLLLPLIMTAIHIFILSHLSEFIYKYWLNHVKRLFNMKKDIEEERLLTVSDSKKIRSENANLKIKLDDQKKEHVLELTALKEKFSKKNRSQKEIKKDQTYKNHSVNSIPSFESQLKEIHDSEWNSLSLDNGKRPILNKDVFNKILSMYKQGLNQYSLNKKFSLSYLSEVENLKSFSFSKGFIFDLDEKNSERTGDFMLKSIQWDRNKFSD